MPEGHPKGDLCCILTYIFVALLSIVVVSCGIVDGGVWSLCVVDQFRV